LKDKAPGVMAMGVSTPAAAAGEGAASADDFDVIAPRPDVAAIKAPSASAQAEALSALGNLGYAPSEAVSAVAEAAGADPDAETAGLIRAALKLLAPKG
jgi:Holliday junction DNA helicase RuvA